MIFYDDFDDGDVELSVALSWKFKRSTTPAGIRNRRTEEWNYQNTKKPFKKKIYRLNPKIVTIPS